MVERFEIQLSLGESDFDPIDGEPVKVLLGSVKRFTFELCRKEADLGDLRFPQFWMDRGSVYGTGKRAARNRAPILDFVWWYRMQTLEIDNKGFQQSLILAHLFEHIRSHGAQRVFADAVLAQPFRARPKKQELIKELDANLANQRYRTIGIRGFRDESAKFLGLGEFSDEVWTKYEEFAGQLLEEGRHSIEKEGIDGLRDPIDCWKRWMATIARRRGHEVEKQVLDILSHESRAALNRCYAIAWGALLKRISDEYQLGDEAVRFHKFWHTEQCVASDTPGQPFRLFHGHVLALHPGAGLFLSTATGAEMMGESLQAPDDVAAYEQLLHGLLIAMSWYARERDDVKTMRKKDAGFGRHFDNETAEEREEADDDNDDDD